MSIFQRRGIQLCQVCWRKISLTLKQQTLDQNGIPLRNVRCVHVSRTARYSGKDAQQETKFNVEENPYFDKYKQKLTELKKSAPGIYQQKLVDIETEFKKDQAFLQEQIKKAEEEAKLKNTPETKTFPPESLDSIMKIDLLQDKTAEDIEEIWKEHHSKKECIYAVLKAIDYEDFRKKSKLCPAFLYPLPRQDGFEFFFSMISRKTVQFTPLAMYQRHKENASPCLTLAYFTEFMDSKDIVLMTGQYENGLTRADALNLVRQLTTYYNRRATERFNLVRVFNNTPEKFNPLDVINEYQESVKFLES